MITLIGLTFKPMGKEAQASETKDGLPKIASQKPQVQSPSTSKDLDSNNLH